MIMELYAEHFSVAGCCILSPATEDTLCCVNCETAAFVTGLLIASNVSEKLSCSYKSYEEGRFHTEASYLDACGGWGRFDRHAVQS